MVDPELISVLRTKYETMAPVLDERARRYWAACEARALGRGGVTAVAQATGISRTTPRPPKTSKDMHVDAGVSFFGDPFFVGPHRLG